MSLRVLLIGASGVFGSRIARRDQSHTGQLDLFPQRPGREHR